MRRSSSPVVPHVPNVAAASVSRSIAPYGSISHSAAAIYMPVIVSTGTSAFSRRPVAAMMLPVSGTAGTRRLRAPIGARTWLLVYIWHLHISQRYVACSLPCHARVHTTCKARTASHSRRPLALRGTRPFKAMDASSRPPAAADTIRIPRPIGGPHGAGSWPVPRAERPPWRGAHHWTAGATLARGNMGTGRSDRRAAPRAPERYRRRYPGGPMRFADLAASFQRLE